MLRRQNSLHVYPRLKNSNRVPVSDGERWIFQESGETLLPVNAKVPGWVYTNTICLYYLRRSRTMSLKFHSQACIFTARIPEMISFITTRRLSVKEAAFFLSFAAFLAINIWKATKTIRNAAPTRAFQPIRYHRISRLITISSGAESIKPTLFKDFSIFCASLETRLIVFPDNVASRLQRLSDRTCVQKNNSTTFMLAVRH